MGPPTRVSQILMKVITVTERFALVPLNYWDISDSPFYSYLLPINLFIVN